MLLRKAKQERMQRGREKDEWEEKNSSNFFFFESYFIIADFPFYILSNSQIESELFQPSAINSEREPTFIPFLERI